MSSIDWRGSTATAASKQSTDIKEGHQLLKLWIPDAPSDLILGCDHFAPVRDIRFGKDEKSFFHGFTSTLQLTERQELYLLMEYAKRYQQSLNRSGGNHGAANKAANTWIRSGATGFLIREY